jgi:hypothetical protein
MRLAPHEAERELDVHLRHLIVHQSRAAEPMPHCRSRNRWFRGPWWCSVAGAIRLAVWTGLGGSSGQVLVGGPE